MQQSHTYRIRTSQRTNQKCGKSVPAPTREAMRSIRKHFKKQTSSEQFQNFFSPAFRKKLNHTIAQPDTGRQKNKWTGTRKTQADSDFHTRTTRTPGHNSVLPQLAVTCKIEAECYYQTFVLGDSIVLRNPATTPKAKPLPASLLRQYSHQADIADNQTNHNYFTFDKTLKPDTTNASNFNFLPRTNEILKPTHIQHICKAHKARQNANLTKEQNPHSTFDK